MKKSDAFWKILRRRMVVAIGLFAAAFIFIHFVLPRVRPPVSVMMLTEAGELVLVVANPLAYTETAKFKILDRYCWNRPVLSNGRIYARNSSVNSEILIFHRFKNQFQNFFQPVERLRNCLNVYENFPEDISPSV